VGNALYGVLFETRDGGESWTLMRENRKSDYFTYPCTAVEFDLRREGVYYLTSQGGVQVTEDGGQRWTFMNEGLTPRARFIRVIEIDPDTPDRIYAGSALGGLWVRELAPTPVRLADAGVRLAEAGGVELHWRVVEASNHAGFHVEREAAGERARLTDTLLQGRTSYRFEDPQAVAGVENRYWIVELDRAGRETEHGPFAVTVPLRQVVGLGMPAPNPFQAATRIAFANDAPRAVRVQVFDAQGRAVATLHDGRLEPGLTAFAWDRTDRRGGRVPSGIYFIRAAGQGLDQTRKVIVTP
jgi:hypothetical protein